MKIKLTSDKKQLIIQHSFQNMLSKKEQISSAPHNSVIASPLPGPGPWALSWQPEHRSARPPGLHALRAGRTPFIRL